MTGFARQQTVSPAALGDAQHQADIAARTVGLNTIPNPKFIYRMTLEKPLLIHIWREANKAILQAAEREGRDIVSRAIEADIAAVYPSEDMDVLRRYELARSPGRILVTIIDRTTRSGNAWIPVDGVWAPDGGFSYIANLDGTMPPPSERGARDVPESAIPYFRRLVEMRRATTALVPETPTSWVNRFKREVGRVPRWHEIEKAFPVIGEWLDMRREAASRPRSLTPEAAS